MTDSKSNRSEAQAPRGRRPWMERAILASVCALVLAVYLLAAHSSIPRSGRMGAADNYYNLLVQGFRAGQLSLKKEVPPGLVQLADPYDPEAHAAYPVFDMSYYKGKFYLYFGVTPAVALFWPYVALTGHYLSQKKQQWFFALSVSWPVWVCCGRSGDATLLT
jgi:hypothetical protein